MKTKDEGSNRRGRRRWKSWLRTLHVHVSIFGLVLLLFFAATGFVMNHENWFEIPARNEPTTLGQIPVEWLAEPDKLAIVELLRETYDAAGPLAKFEVDDDVLHVAFRKPGRSTDAVIYRDDGYMTVDVEIEGILAAMTQLHQGKRTGTAGSLMIDLVAGILAATAIGGLTLWTTLPARRTTGLVSLALGLLLAGATWWYLVL